ncbi:MAG: hypothetical protein ABW122_06310 [Ilumatobacteraceae bacterium]
MPIDPQAAVYRQRAAELRRLADRLDDSPVLTLHQWAGPETWTSPRVEEYRAQLTVDQAQIRDAADDLRREAWRFDRRADELEAAAAVAPPGVR